MVSRPIAGFWAIVEVSFLGAAAGALSRRVWRNHRRRRALVAFQVKASEWALVCSQAPCSLRLRELSCAVLTALHMIFNYLAMQALRLEPGGANGIRAKAA